MIRERKEIVFKILSRFKTSFEPILKTPISFSSSFQPFQSSSVPFPPLPTDLES